MTLRFRNVEFDHTAPVQEWPAEAIATAIERGSLEHWRLIAAAVAEDPWGPLARDVLQLTAGGEPYGVGPGLARSVEQARARWDRWDRAAVAAELASLREASGLTAAGFARGLGTSPSRLSTYLSGQVVPSAALMVRARRLTGQNEPAAGAPTSGFRSSDRA